MFKTIQFNPSGSKEVDYIVEDPFNGKIGIGIKDNYLFGVYNLDDRLLIREYLDQLRKNIRI